MSTKPISPYTRLKETFRKFAWNACYPRKRHMWTYPKDKLADAGFNLDHLNQRVAAAKTLGWDVTLESTDDGLNVYYVEARPTDLPWECK